MSITEWPEGGGIEIECTCCDFKEVRDFVHNPVPMDRLHKGEKDAA